MLLRTDQNFFHVSNTKAFRLCLLLISISLCRSIKLFSFLQKSNHDGDESPVHKTKLGYGVLNQHHSKYFLNTTFNPKIIGKGLLSQQFKIVENKSRPVKIII